MKYMNISDRNFVRPVLLAALMIILSAILLAGCTSKPTTNIEPTPAVQEPQIDDKAIMDAYNKLIAKGPQPEELFQFLDENAKLLAEENAVSIINELEKSQKNYISKLEEQYYAGQEIQAELSKLYLTKKDINNPESTDNEALKKLIDETKKGGYRVETAEGMFFPIINYSAYKNYTQFASEDLKSYIEIMSAESDNVPAKDAALVIGWDEVLERALKQEAFIKKYAASSKLPEIKELYNKYLTFTFLGLNNTPLFSYDQNAMNEEAKTAYLNFDYNTEDSKYKKSLKDFMELLEKSSYKLTPEIDEYRKGIIEKLSK